MLSSVWCTMTKIEKTPSTCGFASSTLAVPSLSASSNHFQKNLTMSRFDLSSALNRFFLLPVGVLIFILGSTSVGSAAAMPQLIFNKRAPISKPQLSVPNKPIGAGHPSPYASSSSITANRSRGASTYGRSGGSGINIRSRSSSYGNNSFSNRSNRTGASIIIGTPPKTFGFSRTTSQYYRPTGPGNFGTTSYRYNPSSYYPSRLYQPYPVSNGVAPRVPPVYPTPSLTSTERSRLQNESTYKPKIVSNQHYGLITTSASARSYQSRAEQAFKNGQYAQAVDLGRLALSQDPGNPKLELFLSHANFATGNFAQSAAYLDRATQKSTSDQWGFVVKNYQKFYGKNDYVSQTDRLNQKIASAPNASALAVRGYHYGSLGYADAATNDFQQALSYDPNNALAKRLLPVLGNAIEPLGPEEIIAPVPQGLTRNAGSVLNSQQPADDGIIRLVPQHSDAEMVDSVPVDSGQSILLNGPTN